jgi:hypothetical protein
VVEIDERIGRPQPGPQLLPGDDLSLALEERAQNLDWPAPEPDPEPLAAQLARLEVELVGAKAMPVQLRHSVHGEPTASETD